MKIEIEKIGCRCLVTVRDVGGEVPTEKFVYETMGEVLVALFGWLNGWFRVKHRISAAEQIARILGE